MSSANRLPVGDLTLEVPGFRAVLYDTDAVMVYRLLTPAETKISFRAEEGKHIATIANSSMLAAMGKLEEVIEGLIELYGHPITGENNFFRAATVVIECRQSMRPVIELIVNDVTLKRVEKAFYLKAAFDINLQLPAEEFKLLFAATSKISELKPGSYPWGEYLSQNPFLVAEAIKPNAPHWRLGNEIDNVRLYRMVEFFYRGDAEMTWGEFSSTPLDKFTFEGHSRIAFTVMLLQQLDLVKHAKYFHDFTAAEVQEFLSCYSHQECFFMLNWLVKRYKSGARPTAQSVGREYYEPFPNADLLLTSAELNNLKHYIATTPTSSLRHFTTSPGKVRAAFLMLIAELGPERVEAILRELAPAGNLTSVRGLAMKLTKNKDLRALISLAREEYEAMPPAFALVLAEVPH